MPSFNSVNQTIKAQEHEGLLEPGSLNIRNPPAVYRWWAGERPVPRASSFHVSSPQDAVAALEAAGVDSAATTYYAENAWLRHVFPRRLDAYVRAHEVAKARKILLDFGAQLGGTNFRILPCDDHLIEEAKQCRERYPGTPYQLAPLPQVIVDLLQERGSPVEAAELLLEKLYHAPKARQH